MSKVKVAVLDTGLDIYDNEFTEKYIYDPIFQLDDFNEVKINDLNGHGTFVSKTILNVSKNVIIYPINIFSNYGKTSSLKLLNSLIKLLKSDIKIINISATSINGKYEKELNRVCNDLKNQDKIIICSKHNRYSNKDSIPTIFPSVIGVEGHKNIYRDNEYLYKKGAKIQMHANSKDCFLRFRNEVTHFGKNSKACAVATGIIANIIKDNPLISFEELEKILIKNSSSEYELEKNLKTKNLFSGSNDKDLQVEEKLINLINIYFAKRKLDINFIRKYGIMNSFTNIGKHNAYFFLKTINKEFNINISYKDILLCDLEEIESLKKIIIYYLKNEKCNKVSSN